MVQIFSTGYLVAPRPTLCQYPGDILRDPVLITRFLQIQPKGHPPKPLPWMLFLASKSFFLFLNFF